MSITLFSGIGTDLRLLQPFLAHYRRLGVDRIFLAVHLRRHEPATVALVTEMATQFDAVVDSVWIDAGLNHRRRYDERLAMIRRRCAPSDWALLADLDEFQHYDCGLEAAVRHCERTSSDYVVGTIVDRIAIDGGFPVLQPNDLWNQFPLECELTRNVLKAAVTKVGVFRAGVHVGPGHHAVLPSCAASACPLDDVHAEFHHFKWDSTVVERLRQRREEVRGEGWDWWQESDAFLVYLDDHGGQLDLADETLAVRRSQVRGPAGNANGGPKAAIRVNRA